MLKLFFAAFVFFFSQNIRYSGVDFIHYTRIRICSKHAILVKMYQQEDDHFHKSFIQLLQLLFLRNCCINFCILRVKISFAFLNLLIFCMYWNFLQTKTMKLLKTQTRGSMAITGVKALLC